MVCLCLVCITCSRSFVFPPIVDIFILGQSLWSWGERENEAYGFSFLQLLRRLLTFTVLSLILQGRFYVPLLIFLPDRWPKQIWVASILKLFNLFFFLLLTGPEFMVFLFNVSRLWVPLTDAEARLLLTELLLTGSFLFTDGRLR